MTNTGRNRLKKIAQRMIAFAQAHPRPNTRDISEYQTQLSGGLTITHYRRGDLYVLSLTRPDVEPALKEVEICRDVFEVPDHALKSFPPVRVIGIKKYHVIRLEWKSIVQLTLVDTPADYHTHNYQED